MTSNADLIARAERVFLPNYKPAPVVFDRGEGAWVFDKDGNKYLDLVSGIAVSLLGHGNARLADVIAAQSKKLIHVSNLYWNEPSIVLAERLVAHDFGERVFFSNSGAEANEAAIKLARRYAWSRGEKERVEIVALNNSFHGRTMGALAATGQPKYREGFEPLPRGFVHVSMGDVAALEAAVGPKTAAIMVEPIQGEGGVRPAPDGYLAEVRRIADAAGAIVIYDEIQTGFGRTGKIWCHQHQGVAPDVMTLAKGIAGGLPLGAMLATSKVAGALAYGTHGTTFGGNPVATAAGAVIMDALDQPGFLANVTAVGDHLMRGLQAIGERWFSVVRGKGLLIGAELAADVPFEAKVIVDAARANGLLLHIAGPRVVRLAPPLILTKDEADQGLRLIERTLEGFAR